MGRIPPSAFRKAVKEAPKIPFPNLEEDEFADLDKPVLGAASSVAEAACRSRQGFEGELAAPARRTPQRVGLGRTADGLVRREPGNRSGDGPLPPRCWLPA